MLGSGKLDLHHVNEMAEKLASSVPAAQPAATAGGPAT
jgi:hypothetical protein